VARFFTAGRAAAALCLLGACAAVGSTSAWATENGWPQTPTVTCSDIVIDPTSWIKVTFTGAINGQPFTETALYGSDGSHNAHVDISDLTANTDNIHIVVTAASNFGFGPVTSRTADVTLNCGSTVTEGSTTPSHGTDPGNGGGTEAGAGTSTNVDAATAHAAGGTLPFTGSEAGRLATIGCALLATGLVAARVRSRRRRSRRPSRGISNYD
jgi:hypothetical protein